MYQHVVTKYFEILILYEINKIVDKAIAFLLARKMLPKGAEKVNQLPASWHYIIIYTLHIFCRIFESLVCVIT